MISFQVTLLRLGLALMLGALVGLEREGGERAAGARTLALVALGSAFFTFISAYGFIDLIRTIHSQYDPSRIASYIVAGIGFLGAGAIFLQNQERVKGLTTAAAIWTVAAIGMACALGLLWLAIIVTAMTLIVLHIFPIIQKSLQPTRTPEKRHLLIEATSIAGPFIGNLYDACERAGITIEKLELRSEGEKKTVEIICHAPDATKLATVIETLHTVSGVRSVEASLRP